MKYHEEAPPPYRIIPLLLLVVTIICLSLTSSPPKFDNKFLGWDKLQHAGAYGLLCFTAGWALLPLLKGGFRPWVIGFTFAVAFGGLLELFQVTLTDCRYAEWADLFADAVGAFTCAFIGFFFYRDRDSRLLR